MINATFSYNQEETIIKCNLEDKIEDICRNFTTEKNYNNLKLYFLYEGNQINLKLHLNEIISDYDKEENKIFFIVGDIEPGFERSNSVASNISLYEPKLNNPIYNNPNDVLIPTEEIIDLNKKKKHYLMIIYLILIIQFILIGINAFLFLLFKYNNIFIANTQSMLWTFIPTSVFFIVMFPSFYFVTKYYKESITWLFIYNILYILCMIFYSFLLSKYIKTEMILSAIILIVLDSLSLEIYIMLFKYYTFSRLIILPIIINIASAILSYFFWIKDIYENIYLFSFGIFIILYLFITIHYISFKYCKNDEYFFALVITNLSVFAGLVIFFKILLKRMKFSFPIEERKVIKKYLLIINTILIIQFVGIFILIKYTLSSENYKGIDNIYLIYFFLLIISSFAYNVVYSLKKNKIYKQPFILGIILFIPLIYAIILSLYNFIDRRYLFCTLILIIVSLIVMEIYILLFIIFNHILLVIITMGITIIVIIYFYFAWVLSFSSIFLMLVVTFVYFIYINIVISKLLKKYKGKEIIFSIACINYVLFFPLAIFFLIVFYIKDNLTKCKWRESFSLYFSMND